MMNAPPGCKGGAPNHFFVFKSQLELLRTVTALHLPYRPVVEKVTDGWVDCAESGLGFIKNSRWKWGQKKLDELNAELKHLAGVGWSAIAWLSDNLEAHLLPHEVDLARALKELLTALAAICTAAVTVEEFATERPDPPFHRLSIYDPYNWTRIALGAHFRSPTALKDELETKGGFPAVHGTAAEAGSPERREQIDLAFKIVIIELIYEQAVDLNSRYGQGWARANYKATVDLLYPAEIESLSDSERS